MSDDGSVKIQVSEIGVAGEPSLWMAVVRDTRFDLNWAGYASTPEQVIEDAADYIMATAGEDCSGAEVMR